MTKSGQVADILPEVDQLLGCVWQRQSQPGADRGEERFALTEELRTIQANVAWVSVESANTKSEVTGLSRLLLIGCGEAICTCDQGSLLDYVTMSPELTIDRSRVAAYCYPGDQGGLR